MIRKKERFFKRMARTLVFVGLALCFVCSAFTPGFSQEQTKFKGEWVLPKDYPDGFDGWGHINRIADEEIVIDEMLYRLSPFVTFHWPPGVTRSRSKFKEGALIGFLKNPGDEITSLWLIK
jgi:hypothetical protein